MPLFTKTKTESYRANYSGIIDTTNLDPTAKAVLKSAWLDYLILLNTQAGRGWFMYTGSQIVIFSMGIAIPLIESTDLNFDIFGSKLKLVALMGAIIAVLTYISRQVGFDRQWIHYRKNAEVIRNEGDDFLALSGPYVEFKNHQEAYKTFMSNLTKLRRQENIVYMEHAEKNIQGPAGNKTPNGNQAGASR